MSTFIGILTMIFLVIVGGLPTLFMVASVPAVLVYKIHRKIHYGISLMK